MRTALLGLALAVIALFAALVGAAAGILARLDGATAPAALARAAVAFAGAFTLGLATLTVWLSGGVDGS